MRNFGNILFVILLVLLLVSRLYLHVAYPVKVSASLVNTVDVNTDVEVIGYARNGWPVYNRTKSPYSYRCTYVYVVDDVVYEQVICTNNARESVTFRLHPKDPNNVLLCNTRESVVDE